MVKKSYFLLLFLKLASQSFITNSLYCHIELNTRWITKLILHFFLFLYNLLWIFKAHKEKNLNSYKKTLGNNLTTAKRPLAGPKQGKGMGRRRRRDPGGSCRRRWGLRWGKERGAWTAPVGTEDWGWSGREVGCRRGGAGGGGWACREDAQVEERRGWRPGELH